MENLVALSKLADLTNLLSFQRNKYIRAEQTKKPWYYNIKTFIETGEFPPELSRKEQRAIQRMSTRYFILANVLYRRGFSSEYSRCLDADEAKEIVREAHEGICGGHVGYQTLVKQIIRAGYYWKIMQQDCYSFCEKVCSMSNTRTFYSCSGNISAICCLSMAVLYVGLRCRRSHHSCLLQMATNTFLPQQNISPSG